MEALFCRLAIRRLRIVQLDWLPACFRGSRRDQLAAATSATQRGITTAASPGFAGATGRRPVGGSE
jgi:hypothetical protein